MKIIKVEIFTLLIMSYTLNVHAQIDTLISIGNHKLHFNIIRGKGVPIIFESGAGNDGAIWKDILNPLHDSTGATLITYDRAGFGKSGIDTNSINIINEIKDLEIGLNKLGYKEKYFFVAHSLGGNYVMTFTNRNSKKVQGGVFIDVVSPSWMTKERAKSVVKLYLDEIEVIKKESIGFYYIWKNYENTSSVMRRVSKSLKIPITIISSDGSFQGTDSLQWIQCLRLFANQANNRKFIVTEYGHYIFKDNPKLVIDEIISLYRELALKK
jgi:pimeloyl-ACP methyl ester carboxylesterase